jgi:hypothetical protein
MIWKTGATALAVIPVAVSTVADGATVATAQPVVWHWLGYQFEAAGMVAALFGCVMARFWIGAGMWSRKQFRWTLDVPVTGMAMASAAGLVMAHHPAPLFALLIGAGFGVIGEGLFKIADKYLRKFLPDVFDGPQG